MRPLLLALALTAALPRPARACGNTTHAWITLDARDRLPAGDLRDVLTRPVAERSLRNGSMFPDGGYAIHDGYGEMAHWEPFQDRYLAWIRANYSPPWSDEAVTHIAFLFGMASHGMADQVYDSNFMEGSKAADPGWHDGCDDVSCSFDTATDLRWANVNGPQIDPERWIPDAFVGLYVDAGHPVSADDMVRGTNLVGSAMRLVALANGDQATQEENEARYPWAFAHLDEDARGAPRNIARVVVPYWQMLWKRLNGGTWTDAPVLTTLPEAGTYSHVRDHAGVGSRLGVVFARGLAKAALAKESFHLADSKGKAHPFSIDLFYGQDSHVVNIQPDEDFAADETYTLTVDPGVEGLDGAKSTAGFSFSVHTGAPPAPPAPPVPEESGCAAVGAGWLALVAVGLRRTRR